MLQVLVKTLHPVYLWIVSLTLDFNKLKQMQLYATLPNGKILN